MSMFILAIFCLTTSNLPWFMDLTLQVPMQCCSLQHQTLLPSPVISTTGHWFCFGSVSLFFLELFFLSSPVAYWTSTELGNSSFSVLSFCLFILFMKRKFSNFVLWRLHWSCLSPTLDSLGGIFLGKKMYFIFRREILKRPETWEFRALATRGLKKRAWWLS